MRRRCNGRTGRHSRTDCKALQSTENPATVKSDIDICVVASTKNKRELLTDLYCDTESKTPIDFLLYTPEEWDQCVSDYQSFAHKLDREGIVLYG